MAISSPKPLIEDVHLMNGILAEMWSIVGATLDISMVYDRFADAASKFLSFDGISVLLFESNNTSAVVHYTAGQKQLQKGAVLPLQGSPLEKIVQADSGLIITAGTQDSAKQEPFNLLFTSYTTGTIMASPLICDGTKIGILVISSVVPLAYSQKDLVVARQIASAIAGPIKNAKTIHELQQVNEILTLKAEMFSKSFHNGPLPMSIMDWETGRHIEVNENFIDMSGYSREEVLGKTAVDLGWITSERHAHIWPGIQAGKGTSGIEIELTKKNGEKLQCLYRSRIITISEKKVVISCVEEISTRRIAENALLDREEHFRLLFDYTFEGIVIHDNCIVIDYNKAMEEMLGYERCEAIGKNGMDFVDPESKDLILHNIGIDYEGRCEINMRRKDGAAITVEVFARPISLPGRKVRVAVIRDITEKKISEENISRILQHLQDKSTALEEANIALKVLLRQREEDKSELEVNLVSGIKELVLPYMERVRKSDLDERQISCLNAAETNLQQIISPFMAGIVHFGLSPREMQTLSLIKDGKTTKEIAKIMGVSPNSVNTYRNNIRKKVNLSKKKVNLHAYLRSLATHGK